MTIDEAVTYIEDIKNGLHETGKDFPYRDEVIPVAKEALDIAIKALEQEPCGDCISREDAIKQCGFGMTSLLIADCLRRLPSVTPQQKVGKWIRIDKDKLKCSECEVIHYIAQYPQSANINYCPNCGAKMEVEE